MSTISVVSGTNFLRALSHLTCAGKAQCFTANTDCTGDSITLTTPEVCCVGDGFSYNTGSQCEICYGEGTATSTHLLSHTFLMFAVFGYSEDSRMQELDEDDQSDLVIEALKPPPGVGQTFLLNFIVENSINTSKLQ